MKEKAKDMTFLARRYEKQFVEITEEHKGRRVDNYLLATLKGVPRSLIYRLLRQGKIRIAGVRVKPHQRLEGDEILEIPFIKAAESLPLPRVRQHHSDLLENSILYEDNYLLILDKPAKIAVHGGSGIRLGLIEMLRQMRPNEQFLELAHRLDRETSGCIIIAKKRSVLKELHELFRLGKVKKEYLALTMGHWIQPKSRIKIPLLKNRLSSGERFVKPSKEGKEASSEFKTLMTYDNASYVSVDLHTGRTHQIRVHAQAKGHPLAGDDKYGDHAFNRYMAKKGLNRLFLHSHKIKFYLPSLELQVDVVADLPEELEAVLGQMHQS